MRSTEETCHYFLWRAQRPIEVASEFNRRLGVWPMAGAGYRMHREIREMRGDGGVIVG